MQVNMSEEKAEINPSESTLYSLFCRAAENKGQAVFFADEYEKCSGEQ